MIRDKLIEDITSRMSDLLANSPAKDIEKNMRAMLSTGFAKLDLVTREEFDVQQEVLARTRAKLEDLVLRVEELERRAGIQRPTATSPASEDAGADSSTEPAPPSEQASE